MVVFYDYLIVFFCKFIIIKEIKYIFKCYIFGLNRDWLERVGVCYVKVLNVRV